MGLIYNHIPIETVLKKAADNSPVPYFITDENGFIIYANKALSETTQYQLDEIIGKKPSLFKSGKHNSQFYQNLWNTIKKGNFYRARLINKKKDGTFYQILLTIQPVIVNEKERYFIAREEDLSQLIELERKLIESQKLEAIALMLGELAHNFNNFLTVIIGSIELIKDEIKNVSPVRTLVEEVGKSARNQANTIKQLLIFARKNKPEITETDLNKILTDIKTLIESQLTSQIKLEYELEPDLLKTRVDDQQIKQAIFNLTQNAKDAIGNTTGNVKIKTYNYVCSSEYQEPYHEGEYAVIEITDSGTGISQDVMKHMFEPFFTTKEKGKGTGLGLSSVYGIIKNHGGYVYASNRTDGKSGAVFRLYFPAAKS